MTTDKTCFVCGGTDRVQPIMWFIRYLTDDEDEYGGDDYAYACEACMWTVDPFMDASNDVVMEYWGYWIKP